MAEAVDLERTPPHVIPLDRTPSLLATLRDDPVALASCDLHEGFEADVVFAAPEGTYYDPDARVVAYCGHHIIKGEGGGDLIPLLDQTGGYWAKRQRYEPVLDRNALEGYETVLAELLPDYQPSQTVDEAGVVQRLIRRATQLRAGKRT